MKTEKKYDVFISYRRDGGQVTARILRDSLTERGYDVFFDVESLRSGAFNTALYSVIDQCSDFILVLSPNALDRCSSEDDWVRREIERALKKKKNVIPILLRGFEFPTNLPESLKDLPYQNGLAANLEYYDAFLDKLETFLHGKKTIWTQIVDFFQSAKKLWMILAAALLASVIPISIWFTQYPRTTEQISLTNGVITNVSYNLTCLDIMADAQHDMLEAAEAYLQTGDDSALSTAFAACYSTLDKTDISNYEPTENLLDWTMDSPFSGDDLAAMHDQLSSFRQEGLDNLAYIEFVLSDECMLDSEDKLKIVSLYKDYLKENRKAFAYATNDLLLPVTRERCLETFWTETLPDLKEIPLNGRNWSRSKDALHTALNECIDNMDAIISEMYSFVDKTALELHAMKENTQKQLTDAGYTEKRIAKIISYMSHDWETELTQSYIRQGYTEADVLAAAQKEAKEKQRELDVMLAFSVKLTDDVNIIWQKMTYLLDLGFYEEAEECIALYQIKMTNSDRYQPALVLFMELMKAEKLAHGIMVMDYVEEDGVNDQLMIGDIIYLFNGEPCRTFADYLAMKAALTTDSYTVKLLRLDDAYQVQVLELTLSTNSPRVYINDLTVTGDE